MDHEDESSSGNAGHQNLNDLHNYLTTFNKEIEPVEDVLSTIGVDTEVGDVGDLYAPSGGHSLQDAGEVAVAGQFSSGFYSEQGILDNPLSDEGGQTMHGLESVPDQDGVEDLTSSIKQEVGNMDLDTVQEQLEGFREHVHLTDTLQNQGLIMTSLGEGLDPTGGKVIRIVSLGEEGQYVTLGDGSQMQILSQELTLDAPAASDTSYIIQGTEAAGASSAPTRARSILSMPANSHLGLSGKSSAAATSLLTSVSGNSGVSNPSSTSQISGMAQLVALQSGDADLQPQLVALPPGTPLTLSAEGLQQYGVLAADGTSSTGELGYQTISVLPTELNQEGMNYVLVMTPQEGDDKQSVAQLVDLKQESQEVREELVEVNGEVKRVLHMVPKKLFPNSVVTGGINMGSQLMCDYCDYTSPKRYLLTRHMKSHSDERPHKCSQCHRGFKTPASLINHVNTHTGTRPHKCKTCDAAFTTSGELVRHIRYRHTFEKPHRCPSCDYASVELSKLKRHMRSHTGERPYKCPHCSYASPDTYKLKRHMRIHTGEKPYECDICHARFTQSNSLKAHKLIHSGNKPVFQCNLCPTTCGRKTDLKIHFNKLHSIGSPLECKKCGQILADRYSFKQHMRTHDMDKCFKCDQCDFIANTERSLDQHAAIHNQGKKYECNLCHMTFNLQQSLEKHSLSCSLDPGYITELKEKRSVLDKSSKESHLIKSEESKDLILPVTNQEESRNQSAAGKTLSGLGQDMFPTPIIASDTLHKNLLQDIKAGKLGDVPQVVIVHPDGTLEEIPASAGDKLNLDDIFSALSGTEKQEMGVQNETVQSDPVQDDANKNLTEESSVQAIEAENMDKKDDAGETVQCEASTQAELESDSESLDESKDLDSPPSKQVNHLQKKDMNMQENKEVEPKSDGSLTIDGSCKNFNQTIENSSSLTKEGDLSSHHVKTLTSIIEKNPSPPSLPSFTQSSQSDSLTQLSPTSLIANSSGVKSSDNNGSVTSSSGSSNAPQYVVVKGYTCLSEDGNTVQPTLVNVAVDKDSLMKMFASLGPAGDGMGLQLLSGDLEPSSGMGEEHAGRIAQASIIPLHDMAALTTMGEAEVGITDDANSNLLEIANGETLSNRDSGLTELCDFAADQSEILSSKDSGFDSTSTFELGESCHSTSSILSSKNTHVNSDNDEDASCKKTVTPHVDGRVGGQSLIEANQEVNSTLSQKEESVGGMSLLPKEGAEDYKSSSMFVKQLPASPCITISHQKLSSAVNISNKVSCKGSSKATAVTDQNVASPPCAIRDNTSEVKISHSEDSLSEPLQLVDVEGPPMFHISDETSISVQPTFSDAPLGNLFTDSFVEDSSSSHLDPTISDSIESKEDTEIDVCVETDQTINSGRSSVIKLEDLLCDNDPQRKEERPTKLTPKQKGPSKRRASSSPAVDSNLVRTGKRVRKALVKVSM